jgi:hypothetical protein
VRTEAEKLGVFDQAVSLIPQVVRDDARRPIEEQLTRDAAKEAECLLDPPDEDAHVPP